MQDITEQLIIDRLDGVGRITFDNPERRNALTYEMWRGLPVVLDNFESDDTVRVIVLAGAGGKAFSAGADISEFAKIRSTEDAVAVYSEAVTEATHALFGARKPMIAQIEGFCIGGGLGVAMCCDLRIAAADSRFADRRIEVNSIVVYPMRIRQKAGQNGRARRLAPQESCSWGSSALCRLVSRPRRRDRTRRLCSASGALATTTAVTPVRSAPVSNQRGMSRTTTARPSARARTRKASRSARTSGWTMDSSVENPSGCA